MASKSTTFFLIVSSVMALTTCQIEETNRENYLTNDSTKYWDMHEQTYWDDASQDYKLVKGLENTHTCWEFSATGRWTDYSTGSKGKLRDKNLTGRDTFYENKWLVNGDTLSTGKGSYLIQKLTGDTLHLIKIGKYRFEVKLHASVRQQKEICRDIGRDIDCK